MGSSVTVVTPYHHCPRNRSWRYFMGCDAKLSLTTGSFRRTRSFIRVIASHCPFTKLFSIHSFDTSHSSRYSVRYSIRQCIDIKSFFEHLDYSTSERNIVFIVMFIIIEDSCQLLFPVERLQELCGSWIHNQHNLLLHISSRRGLA